MTTFDYMYTEAT